MSIAAAYIFILILIVTKAMLNMSRGTLDINMDLHVQRKPVKPSLSPSYIAPYSTHT